MPSFLEPPTTREQPSYFNARESIIPKLSETPISKPPVIKPADITPSTIIKTREPIPEPEPPKPVIKPSEVAPPKIDTKPSELEPPKATGRAKFYSLVTAVADLLNMLEFVIFLIMFMIQKERIIIILLFLYLKVSILTLITHF
jgi:hypothetical protein